MEGICRVLAEAQWIKRLQGFQRVRAFFTRDVGAFRLGISEISKCYHLRRNKKHTCILNIRFTRTYNKRTITLE